MIQGNDTEGHTDGAGGNAHESQSEAAYLITGPPPAGDLCWGCAGTRTVGGWGGGSGGSTGGERRSSRFRFSEVAIVTAFVYQSGNINL